MKKRMLSSTLILAFSFIAFTPNANAAVSNGISIDLVRMLDTNQNPKYQGMNIGYQISITSKSAIYVGYAYMHPYKTHIVEAGWKYYIQKYLNGVYLHLGANYWVSHNKKYRLRDSLAADIRIGYELPINSWLVLSGGISGVFGPPSPTDVSATNISKYGFFFRPHLGFIAHF